MVNDQDLDRGSLSFQLQTELLLQVRENGLPVRRRALDVARVGRFAVDQSNAES